MMKRIICVGHSALDRVFRIDAFPPVPSKIRALEHIESGGGMAANTAVTIAKLGGKAELWSRIGDDDVGVKIRAGLKAAGVDARHVQMFEDGRSSTSATIVDSRGERLIVGARDINMPSGTSWLPLERVSGADAVIADVRWLEAVRAVFERARKEGIPTVLDVELGVREAIPELLAVTDYAIFSKPALKDFMPEGTNKTRLRRVLGLGPEHVGVTLGADGYQWAEGDRGARMPAFKVDVVDTTGAGDAFHGAFTLGLVEGLSAAECARMGAAVAAMNCTRLGARAGLPTRAELAAFLAAHV